MEEMRNDWNLLKDKLEIDIIKKYARYTNMVTTTVIVGCIGFTTVWGTGASIIVYLTHLCALLEIASYRIDNAIDRNILAMPSPKKQYLLHRRIVNAVVMHQRAAEFNDFMTSVFLIPFALLIVVGVSSLTLSLFLLCRLILSNNISKALVIVILTLAHLIYLFIANYCGQVVINNGIDLFKATYNGLWYAAPLSTQKLLLFIMQRGRENLTISCFSIFIASLDGFATVKLKNLL
ncbi:PREDICTED: uncharacterized protein LOC105559954 isoform X2 [Vollenhovia emeryi]|uniref:uncharacterized protein LOC105559954 isoform X2 n=1 Tax=Vollenhovia emeryi TaxID=411798 RepID=UPI0005F3771B|nr:PREDICTED: uncharacterized protein LOC105559954 isoform X2 [Vollenhovia emeryi]